MQTFNTFVKNHLDSEQIESLDQLKIFIVDRQSAGPVEK